MSTSPLFASSREALTFAANYKSAAIKEPAMYRMLNEMRKADQAAKDEEREAKEDNRPVRVNTLAGYTSLDKAGQSGFILQTAGRLTDSHVHHMMAAVLKPRELCNCRSRCCRGWYVNADWLIELRHVDDELYQWLESQRVVGKKSAYTLSPALRVEIVRQFFDRESKEAQVSLAERFGISETALAAHQKKIGKHLTGVIRSAFSALDVPLVQAGIVGSLE